MDAVHAGKACGCYCKIELIGAANIRVNVASENTSEGAGSELDETVSAGAEIGHGETYFCTTGRCRNAIL